MPDNRDLSLAELESELRNAYVKKVLDCQIREKMASREIRKIRETYDENLEKLRLLEMAKEAKELDEKLSKNRKRYGNDLARQMFEREESKRMAELEAKKERKELEEFDRIVEANDLSRKIEKKLKLTEMTRRDKVVLEELKIIRKRMERERDEKLTRENEKYREDIDERSRELKKLLNEQNERRERLTERVARFFVNNEARKNYARETKIRDLIAEEIAWEIVVHEREEELRRKKMRENLKKGLEEQMEFAAERARRRAEMDREFTENVMRRLMESERIEKLTKDARARSKVAYRRDLERLMEERERIRQIEIERIKEEFKRDEEFDEIRKKEIRDARKDILLRHAENVGSYVNDHLLTEEERKIIDRVLKN